MKKIIIAFMLMITLIPATMMAKSGFTLYQLPSTADDIGNSFVMVTDKGKVIVMDGGRYGEHFYLRGFLAALGNEVEAWIISHPHDDHVGAITEILEKPNGIKIKNVYHSRFSESLIDCEKPYNDYARRFYAALDTATTTIHNQTEPGLQVKIDGLNFKILGVTNEEIRTNPFNNSSMIVRVWDKEKSILFLGDAGVECGDKLMAGPFGKELDSDYVQVAHHGQQGCSKEFYDKLNFRACIWCTPTWVWTNNQGGGYNTGNLKTFETRQWMDEKGIKEHHVTCLHGLFKLK